MLVSGWPITLLLFLLFSSVNSSPVSIYTPDPPLASQISPPMHSPTILPSQPSLSIPPSIPSFISHSGESAERARCLLTLSPSTLVVRFADPVTANCSVPRMEFSLLGWEVPLAAPEPTMDRFLVWSVDRMTEWGIKPICYALAEQGGDCHINLPLTIYKDRHHWVVYSPTTTQKKTPVTEIFTLDITPSKEEDRDQYWCEAKLELGPEGPQHPPVAISQKLTATVHFGPQLACPTKLQVREGERLTCEVRGNPQPSVIWFRDGKLVTPPTNTSRKHAGKYTILAKGLKKKNFTVEVEVLDGSGTASRCNRCFLLAVLLIQITWL